MVEPQVNNLGIYSVLSSLEAFVFAKANASAAVLPRWEEDLLEFLIATNVAYI